MLNLLPLEQKKKIEKEYKNRFLIVSLIFSSIAIVILFVFSLPSYVFSKIRLNQVEKENTALEERIAVLKQDEAALSPEDTENIQVLSVNRTAQYSPTELTEKILSNKGNGISISNISISFLNGEQIAHIQGVARTRENLIAYRQELVKLEIFKEVDLPISSLGPARNNEFTMELTVLKK